MPLSSRKSQNQNGDASHSTIPAGFLDDLRERMQEEIASTQPVAAAEWRRANEEEYTLSFDDRVYAIKLLMATATYPDFMDICASMGIEPKAMHNWIWGKLNERRTPSGCGEDTGNTSADGGSRPAVGTDDGVQGTDECRDSSRQEAETPLDQH